MYDEVSGLRLEKVSSDAIQGKCGVKKARHLQSGSV